MIVGLKLEDVALRLLDSNSLLAGGATPGAITFGLAQLEQGETAPALIERADAALYRARMGRAQ